MPMQPNTVYVIPEEALKASSKRIICYLPNKPNNNMQYKMNKLPPETSRIY